jgi:Glyoxalase-like domain
MANLDAAVAFVRSRADKPTLVRLAAVLGVRVSSAEMTVFTADQLLGGGWPAWWSGGQASLDATCERLSVLEGFGAVAGVEAVRALGYISTSQRADGTWQEPSALVRNGPVHLRPGHPDAVAWVTAHCAFWLALGGQHRARVELATVFLRSLDALPLRVRWLTAAALYRLGDARLADTVINQASSAQVLETSPKDLSHALQVLRIAGVPISHPSIAKARSLLGAVQRDDGSWAAPGSAVGDVLVTLEAVRALRLTELVTLPPEPAAPRATVKPEVRPSLSAVIVPVRDLVAVASFWRRLLRREASEQSADHASFAFDGVRVVFRLEPDAPVPPILSLGVPNADLNAMLERARVLGAVVVQNRFEAGRLVGVVFDHASGVRFELIVQA